MKAIFAAIALAGVLFIEGCGSAISSDPKATLSAFFDAMSKKDIEAARKLSTADSKNMFDMMEIGLKMSKENQETEKFDRSKMEMGEPTIEGDKATVPVKDKKSGESVNFTLKKEEGVWKVAFNMTSIMEMAAGKLQEKGISTDSVRQSVEALKNINLDSLKQGIDKGIEALDSAKQLLESMKK